MRRCVFVVGALLLISCSSDRPPAEARSSSGSTAPNSSVSPAPTTTSPGVPTTSSPLSPIAGCPDPGPLAEPDPNRPRYEVLANVDVANSLVEGTVTVQFTPDLPTNELVFRLWPNSPIIAAAGGHEDVGPITQAGGGELNVDRPDDTTVHVSLPTTLAARSSIQVTVPFTLQVAGPNDDRVARDGDTMRLGSFAPLLAWEPGVGWALDPPTSAHAEAATSPVADYDVNLTVPGGYDVLGTGEREGTHWRAIAVRDIAFSIGHFTLLEDDVNGVHVTLGVDRSITDRPQRYMDLTTTALRDYEARLGAYPWSTYSAAVLPGFEGGIEFPTHVMHGAGSATRSIVHEVAHQWFYALVGNDQGRDPWIDEGLASYAEFVEVGSLERNRDTALPADAAGRAGDPMTYWDQHQASYYRGVYVQAAVGIASLGSVDQVDCALRQFVAHDAFRVTTPADFFDAIAPVLPDAPGRLAPYGLHP
ncbi:MAG TPA: M1 family aminopeptidase [Acidimicrobiales bacterium]|nr:M1 family aminopeptidase [Acidimicrobiales bacterium]